MDSPTITELSFRTADDLDVYVAWRTKWKLPKTGLGGLLLRCCTIVRLSQFSLLGKVC